VTFLFTDIEGSTRLWQEDEASMREAVARHDQLLGEVIGHHGGVVFSTMGDGLAAGFQTASAAVRCAVEAQSRLDREPWGTVRPLRVRMGLHTGEAELRGGDYFGTAVNRAARLVAVGHRGQIICSSATAEVGDSDIGLVDLGEHRLRDLDRPMHVFQIGDGSFPPLRSLSTFPGNLPIQLTSFVGRQEELASLTEALGTSRLVTLIGSGGVGKTRLSLQAAANLVTRFSDGVWLCELAAAVDSESMLQVVTAALGYVPAPGADLVAGTAKFVGPRRVLLVLDNCEHLLDAAAGLAETALERCPNLAILATSREALEVLGERVVRVRPLPVPQPGASLDQLVEYDASRLFLDRVEATGSDLTLEAADGPAVAEICRRLDGIPLAIELAAARVIALAPREIAAHLDERFRLLTGGRRAAVERHHTLRATIDWSYALLSERDQTVFNLLGVFPAAFDASAAQAVAGAGEVEAWDVLDALSSLVAKSMVNADRSTPGPTRYQMLESLRHYARERLEATNASDDARRWHARHYARMAADMTAGLRGPDEISWRRRLDADLDNFRAAVAWALDSVTKDDADLAMVILGELVIGQSAGTLNPFAGIDYEHTVEQARQSAPGYASAVLAAAAMNAYCRGDFRRARELSREAMQGVRMAQHPSGVLGVYFTFLDPKRLPAELTSALQLLDEVGADPSEYAEVHGAAAGMAAVVGNVELAQQEAAIVLDEARRIGNPSLLALGLYAFGLSSWQADRTTAQTALEEHVQIVRSTGQSQVLGRVLALLAQLRAGNGDRSGAQVALRQALESAHINDDYPAMGVCLARGAVVMEALGELEIAAVFVGAVQDGIFAHLTLLPANETPDHSEFIEILRWQVGEDGYTFAAGRGAAMTCQQITAFALDNVKHLGSTIDASP
jgi:predicted ATPase